MTYDLACTVTGANGFVGRHLCHALMKQRDFSVRVFAVDLQDAAHESLMPFEGGALTYHKWDVTQPLHSNFLAVDAIYHLAGIADPRRYTATPITVMDLNLMGLRNILERIVLWSDHRPRIIYSSTSEVYGLNDDVPFREDSPMIFGHAMRWTYALSKAVGEKYLAAYSQQHEIRYTIFRFFNFVGDDIDAPGAGRVLTQMVGDAMKDGVIRVTEPGTQTRCFTHIDDAADVLVRALHMKVDECLWLDDYTVNLGNDVEITMLELAKNVRRQLEVEDFVDNVEIDVVPRTELYGPGYDDSPRRKPDLTRAREIFGWAPKRRQTEFLPDVVRAIATRVSKESVR